MGKENKHDHPVIDVISAAAGLATDAAAMLAGEDGQEAQAARAAATERTEALLDNAVDSIEGKFEKE